MVTVTGAAVPSRTRAFSASLATALAWTLSTRRGRAVRTGAFPTRVGGAVGTWSLGPRPIATHKLMATLAHYVAKSIAVCARQSDLCPLHAVSVEGGTTPDANVLQAIAFRRNVSSHLCSTTCG